MNTWQKPKLVVSKCLEFEACRYNGEKIPDSVVRSLTPFVEWIPICPEVEIGLGTPRETIRIVRDGEEKRLVQPSTGKDITDVMNTFSDTFLSNLPDIDGFVLKNRSPSCGTNDVKVYQEANKPFSREKSGGLFGSKVVETFSHLAIEEEGRLRNFRIREHFFIKIFTLAAFRHMKGHAKMKDLVAFQARNKYLFMAYGPLKQKELGRIVANDAHEPLEVVIQQYEKKLYELFAKMPNERAHINVCSHIYGYFSKQLNKQEKDHFHMLIEKYEEKKIPLSVITTLLRSWVMRFNQAYLEQQTYFGAYPDELIEISDSGKGRNLS